MREELGAPSSRAWTASSQGAFALLHLLAFFTAGEDKPPSPGTCATA